MLTYAQRVVNTPTVRSLAQQYPQSDARTFFHVCEYDIIEDGKVICTLHTEWLAKQAIDDRCEPGKRWFDNIERASKRKH